MGTSNVTLYANGRSININVAFQLKWRHGGDSQNVLTNTKGHPTITGADKDRLHLAGWYSDAGLTSVFNFTTPITAPITLYAKWT